MFNWNSIKYSTVIHNDNYVLFERKNLEGALVALHVSVDFNPLIVNDEVKVHIYINQSNNHAFSNIIMQDKKINQRSYHYYCYPCIVIIVSLVNL